jgi:hypothetical protein
VEDSSHRRIARRVSHGANTMIVELHMVCALKPLGDVQSIWGLEDVAVRMFVLR